MPDLPETVNTPIRLEELAYTTGRVVRSGESLALPIIDTRNYTDDIADIHTRIRPFSFLDRLQKTNGTTANEVNWLVALSGSRSALHRAVRPLLLVVALGMEACALHEIAAIERLDS